jgi:conjugate transposon
MKRYLFYIIVLLCIAGCNDALDVQQVYKYTIETMPVPTTVKQGETVEIRFQISREGEYKDTKYYIRYFQPQGKGVLKTSDGLTFTPNDRFPLESEIFRLYYTSTSTDQQVIDVYVEDSFGQVEKVSFSFTNTNEK